MLDADRRDMSVWSLVMCIDTLVAGAVSVARLGTPAAIVHGCTGFPIAFMLGEWQSSACVHPQQPVPMLFV